MLTLTINGVDRTEDVTFRSLQKIDNINDQVDTLRFTIEKNAPTDYVPSLNDEVVLERNGVTLFGGVIVRMTESTEGALALFYEVECNDYSQFLKRQLVSERYENMTVSEIVDALVADYTTDGFTTVNTTSTLEVRSISFNRITVMECLQKLSNAIGYVWYVDYDKDIHFYPKNAESAPYALTDTSGNYIKDTLEIVEDLTQLKNGILVQGGEIESTTPRTEYESGDGTRVQFPLKNKFSSIPTVTVGGVTQTVGKEYLDQDADFDVMWNFNEKYLRFTAGNTPASGTNNIEIEGQYLYPIVVFVPAPASQVAFGEYEFAITDRTIRSQAEAVTRAQAELAGYQNQLHEGSFTTYTDGLRSGQVLSIESDQRGKSISVLIQSVRMRMVDPLANILEYDVRFATVKSIEIIEYLQSKLRSQEVIVDDQETILNFFPLADSIGFSDELAEPTVSTGPYVWGTATWGYSVWG